MCEGGKRFDAFLVDRFAGTIANAEPMCCSELAWFDLDELPELLTPATAEILHVLRVNGSLDR